MSGLAPRSDAAAGPALTAEWTAAIGAQESERRDALFHDPLARDLAGPEGLAALKAGRSLVDEGTAITVRTKFFDDQLLRSPAGQVVVLGAGMDARAFRLRWPPQTPVFEVDRPDVLELKRERLGDAQAKCIRIEVPMDLSEDRPQALLQQGFRQDLRTVWLAEAFLPIAMHRRCAHCSSAWTNSPSRAAGFSRT